MVSINTLTTATQGSVEARPVQPQAEARSSQGESNSSSKVEDAAVATVPVRQERLLRNPEAASALAQSLSARLKSFDKESAIAIQANSRTSDVHDLLS